MELYFTDKKNISKREAEFDNFETQHILKTMRKKLNDSIFFTDGQGRLFKGRIKSVHPKLKVEHELIEEKHTPQFYKSLGIGFIRPARLDFIIEKGTELGINKFNLFASKYSNYYTVNTLRWQKIARQAIKQSVRLFLPEIITHSSFNSFVKSVSDIKFKFLANQGASPGFQQAMSSINYESGDDLIFVIGPEGGFDESENHIAKEKGFNSISFGKHRLRTETAAIAAASYINLYLN